MKNHISAKGMPPTCPDDLKGSLDFSQGSLEVDDGCHEITHSDYGLSYATFLPESPQTVRFPMLVVEEQSTLDVRDCYMRSIRKDYN
jgi:hypothetical protein